MRSLCTRSRARTSKGRVACAAALSACLALVVACDDRETSLPRSDDPDAGGAVDLPDSGAPDAPVRPRPPKERDPYAWEDEEVVCGEDAGPCATQIVAGRDHFCALMAGGTVHCWGSDEHGNLGRGSAAEGEGTGEPWAIPPVRGLAGATQISAGADTTCARLEDGTIRCWGGNRNAELGLSEDGVPIQSWGAHPDAVEPSGVASATRVDVGHGSVCAVLTSGELWCWGDDAMGQLARPLPTEPWLPGVPGRAEVEPLVIAEARSGTNTTLGLTKGGELWAWGALSGKEGYCSGVVASVSPSRTPRKILELSNVTSFAISEHFRPDVFPHEPLPQAHACAIAGGDLHCWGRSDKVALCTGKPEREIVPAPAPVVSEAWPQRVVVAREITCVRMTDGTVQCCGSNERGRMALPVEKTHASLLTEAAHFKGYAVQLAASDGAVCALVQGGTVECWGSNRNGELGTPEPDESDHPEPTLISF